MLNMIAHVLNGPIKNAIVPYESQKKYAEMVWNINKITNMISKQMHLCLDVLSGLYTDWYLKKNGNNLN